METSWNKRTGQGDPEHPLLFRTPDHGHDELDPPLAVTPDSDNDGCAATLPVAWR